MACGRAAFFRVIEIRRHPVSRIDIVVVNWNSGAHLRACLAALPGVRARQQFHPRARAISAIGWASVIIWPLWRGPNV